MNATRDRKSASESYGVVRTGQGEYQRDWPHVVTDNGSAPDETAMAVASADVVMELAQRMAADLAADVAGVFWNRIAEYARCQTNDA